jgi:hypothetical protein
MVAGEASNAPAADDPFTSYPQPEMPTVRQQSSRIRALHQ